MQKKLHRVGTSDLIPDAAVDICPPIPQPLELHTVLSWSQFIIMFQSIQNAKESYGGSHTLMVAHICWCWIIYIDGDRSFSHVVCLSDCQLWSGWIAVILEVNSRAWRKVPSHPTTFYRRPLIHDWLMNIDHTFNDYLFTWRNIRTLSLMSSLLSHSSFSCLHPANWRLKQMNLSYQFNQNMIGNRVAIRLIEFTRWCQYK